MRKTNGGNQRGLAAPRQATSWLRGLLHLLPAQTFTGRRDRARHTTRACLQEDAPRTPEKSTLWISEVEPATRKKCTHDTGTRPEKRLRNVRTEEHTSCLLVLQLMRVQWTVMGNIGVILSILARFSAAS